jgi:hypothetical protein
VEPAAVHLIARLAAGGMRDAESILDQLLSTTTDEVTEADVRELLGLADAAAVDGFLEALLAGDVAAGIALLDRLEERGRDPRALLDQVVDAVRARLVDGAASGDRAASDRLAAVARRLVAIDPDQRHAWLYDGFDLRNGDATLWAAEVTRRQTEHRFEAFIIDQQMGKEHPPGAGLNVAQQYFAALTEAGIEPRVLGPLGGFFPGSNDVLAREEALLGWMQIRGSGPFSGSPRLQVMRGRAPAELDKQIRMAHYDLKKPDKRVHENEDLLVCLEYAAAYNPTYREPEPIPVDREPTPAELLKAKRRRQQQRGTNRSREVVPGLELG